jgi:hypothetical protein
VRSRAAFVLALVATTLATPVLAGFAGTDLFIPMAGRGVGAYPSNWFTTVYLYNPNPTAVTVDLSFLERNKDNVATAPPKFTDTLAPGETRIYENIVETSFGRTGTVYGAVRIQCIQKVVASTRVYSKESDSAPLTQSFGQDFAATPASFAIGLNESTDILGGYTTQPYQDSQARFNIGCVETTGVGSATVRWIARDASGQEQKHYDRLVPRLSQTQGFFHDYFTGVDLTNARISANVIAGSGKVICYGSLVTNDKTFPKPVQDPTTFEMVYPDKLLGIATVQHDATLKGDGTAGALLGITDQGVGTQQLADAAVTDAKVGNGIAYTKLSGAPATLPPSGPAAGALAGTYPNPGIGDHQVTQAKLFAQTATAGQVLATNGTELQWQKDGLTLPYAGVVAPHGVGFDVWRTLDEEGAGFTAIKGRAGHTDLLIPAAQVGVMGLVDQGFGVRGEAEKGTGVYGGSKDDVGVYGVGSNSGVEGWGVGYGVFGQSVRDWPNGPTGYLAGPYGANGTFGDFEGYLGFSDTGVVGKHKGSSNQGHLGRTDKGVWGRAFSSGGIGVHGESSNGVGVYGSSGGAYAGVHGFSTSKAGVWGESTSDAGLLGTTSTGYAGYFIGRLLNTNLAGSGEQAVCADSAGVLKRCASDARLKKDVAEISSEIDVTAALAGLRPMAFTWDTSQDRAANSGDRREIGLIAQEVETVLPHVVSTGADGYKSVDYAKLTALLIEVAKAQQARIDALERRLAAVENR